MTNGTLVLIDGNSYLFRAFHAITGMTRSDGSPTGAVFGFLNSLDLIEKTVADASLVAVFDTAAPTFRAEIDEGYKANRDECPAKLVEQIPIVKGVLDALGIPRFEMDGYEADDLIGTIARWWERRGGRAVIASGDKDLLQLVTGKVSVLRTHLNKTKIYDPEAVREKYQVLPERLPDVLALMGDSVDNIPGVPGIGEKTAGSLIAEFDSLDGVFANLDKVKGPKRRQTLQEHRDVAFRALELATIRIDAPVEVSEDLLARREPDADGLYALFSELEFRTRAAHWRGQAGVAEPAKSYELVESLERLADIIAELDTEAALAFDTETDSLDAQNAELVGFSFAQKDGEAYYVSLTHADARNVDREKALDVIRDWLEDPRRKVVAHNLKYDAHVLARYGLSVRGADDTMLMSQLADPDSGSHGLKDLSARLLQMPMASYEDIAGKGQTQRTFDELTAHDVYEYGAADSDATQQLHAYYSRRIAERGVKELYEDVERPLVDVLRRMESLGVLIDAGVLAEQSRELACEMAELETLIQEEAGHDFNLRSTAQLAKVLYDEMGLKPPGRTRSTRADVLEKLAAQGVPICHSIIEYRQRAKLKSTYLDALPGLVSPRDGRVHTTYHQASANTGRISSSDPNLQNIPVRTEMGKRVRSAFVAPEGKRLLSADYSQIELRILGHLAEDPGLLGAFERGEDIHTKTASEIFGVPASDVDDSMRSKAKAVNFGLNYGMTAHGLAERLGIGRAEAQKYINAFFDNFPRVRAYLDGIVEKAKADGYIRTLMGRRIPARGLEDQSRQRREAARRAAINAPIQGAAADMLKKAMVCVDAWIEKEHPPAAMLLTVHDELVFEVEAGALEEVSTHIRGLMEGVMDLGIPTPVDIASGGNWAEL